MILGGYLILPATYDSDPKLRFSDAVLDVFVGALLTAGYSFTGLLCFACPNWIFQAEAVFLPSLTSSALGVLTIVYNFASSNRYQFNTGAIIAIALSVTSTFLYGLLLLWTYRKIARVRKTQTNSRAANMWQENPFYANFLANMYPTARTPSEGPPLTEEEMVNQQMAALLKKGDPGPSPDASQSTFRIDMPEEREDTAYRPQNRATLAPEVMTMPRIARSGEREREAERQQQRGIWGRRFGREERGRTVARESPDEERAKSREERRREIEMGRLGGGAVYS